MARFGLSTKRNCTIMKGNVWRQDLLQTPVYRFKCSCRTFRKRNTYERICWISIVKSLLSSYLILELIEKIDLISFGIGLNHSNCDLAMPVSSTTTTCPVYWIEFQISSYFINVPDERGNSSIIFILLNTITQSCIDVAN